MSQLGYGMWGVGTLADSDDDASFAAMNEALRRGCTFFDSARAYGDGRTDRLLGRLLAEHPDVRVFTSSKLPPAIGGWPATDLYAFHEVFPRGPTLDTARRIRDDIGVDTVDLLHFHVWHDRWATEAAFADLVGALRTEGLVAHLGISVSSTEPGNGLAALRTGHIDVVQALYNIFAQKSADELLPYCLANDIGVIARVPFDLGSFVGALTPHTTFAPDDYRSEYFAEPLLTQTLARVRAIEADLHSGLPLPEAALRFVLSHPAVATTIAGMRSVAHVAETFRVAAAPALPTELVRRLEQHRWERSVPTWRKDDAEPVGSSNGPQAARRS